MTKTLPELRAGIIAGILKHVTETPKAISYDAVFRRALDATGLPEVEVGEEIRDATSCLIFSGALLSNGFVRESMEIYYSADMEIVPGPWVAGFVWRDQVRSAEAGSDV